MDDKDGGPAFPREDYQASDAPGQRGMSLRDYFAGQFLTTVKIHEGVSVSGDVIARNCYAMADAMLAERVK